MKAKHHFWSSIVAGGALYWATGEASALAGAMIGGFLIDADHIVDQLWSIWSGAPLLRPTPRASEDWNSRGVRRWFARSIRRRKLLMLPLIFHSYELLAVTITLALIFQTPFLIGLSAGYALHIALDLYRHHHEFQSQMFYLLSYRLFHRFRRERLIKQEYL